MTVGYFVTDNFLETKSRQFLLIKSEVLYLTSQQIIILESVNIIQLINKIETEMFGTSFIVFVLSQQSTTLLSFLHFGVTFDFHIENILW